MVVTVVREVVDAGSREGVSLDALQFGLQSLDDGLGEDARVALSLVGAQVLGGVGQGLVEGLQLRHFADLPSLHPWNI